MANEPPAIPALKRELAGVDTLFYVAASIIFVASIAALALR